jgi:hypothetical protein
MKARVALAALGAATTLTGLGQAQVDYSFNWHNMSFGFLGGAAFSTGPVIFGFGQTFPNWAGPGDSIRTCWGIDSTQGGIMQVIQGCDISWFCLVQGWAANNAIPGVDYGLVSFHGASVDSITGDACFSSFFGQGVDPVTTTPVTLNSALSFAFVPGLQAGTAGLPAPTFWFSYFQFLGPTGLVVPNILGNDPGFPAAPLLANIIMEVQGPVNGGPTNQQYFVLSTAEVIGLGNGTTGAGGVANGNSAHGSSIFAGSADATNMVSHNRLTSFDPAGGLFGTTNTQFGGGPGTDQWFGAIAGCGPALWASQGGNTGAGGPDWRISSQSSLVNLRVLDMRGGAEGSALATPPGATTSVTNPGLVANFPFALWSATPGAGMMQKPMSWDAVPPLFAQAGSIVLGPQATSRGGPQTVPINFDAVTAAFLNQAVFSSLANFQAAVDPNADGNPASLFEDGVGEGIDGSSQFTTGALPVGPKPNLANRNIGVAAVGIQFDIFAFTLNLTEFATSLTLTLQ